MKSQKRRSPKGRKLKRRNPGKREGGQKKSRKTKTATKVRMRWLHFLFSTAFNCCLLTVTVEVRLLKNFRGVGTCSFQWVPMSFSEFLCWPLRNYFPQEELYSKDVPVDQLSTRFYQLLSESVEFSPKVNPKNFISTKIQISEWSTQFTWGVWWRDRLWIFRNENTRNWR